MTSLLTTAQLLLGLECVYLVSVALLKLSLLALYFRIFLTREFKLATYILSGLIILWCIALNCVAIFQCNPVKKSWLPTTPGTCIDLKAAFIGNAIPNIITDVVILLLPVRQIWKLQMRPAQRISLIAMFLLGGLCVSPLLLCPIQRANSYSVLFASIYRLIAILKFNPMDTTCTLTSQIARMHTLTPLRDARRSLRMVRDRNRHGHHWCLSARPPAATAPRIGPVW